MKKPKFNLPTACTLAKRVKIRVLNSRLLRLLLYYIRNKNDFNHAYSYATERSISDSVGKLASSVFALRTDTPACATKNRASGHLAPPSAVKLRARAVSKCFTHIDPYFSYSLQIYSI
jgi:hypothetical protein